MAENTITSQLKIDSEITPDFSFDWELEYKGSKYIMPLRQPRGSVDNESLLANNDLTFQHWAEYQLKRWWFFTVQSRDSALPDKYIASVSLNLKDFCELFGMVLSYYFGNAITIDLNPNWLYQEEATNVEISNTSVWDVLTKFYELFAVRWRIEPAPDNNNLISGRERYVIKVGYGVNEVSHLFRHGFEGGLLKIERQVQDDNIRNLINGRGGEKNLPHRYFKKHDNQNASFSPDPDWIPELENMYFSELRGATFRSYIQGWKAAHLAEYKLKYPAEEWSVSVTKAEDAYSPWAWKKGNTDKEFDPVEYVADEIVIVKEVNDKIVRFTPKYSPIIKSGSSIDKYGPLFGGLDNNEEIHPTIQGIDLGGSIGRVDEVIAVQKIESDETEVEYNGYANKYDAPKCKGDLTDIAPAQYKSVTLNSQGDFTVPKGEHADLNIDVKVLSVSQGNNALSVYDNAEIKAGSQSVTVINVDTGEEHAATGIPEGTWTYRVSCSVHNLNESKTISVTVGDDSPIFMSGVGTTQPGNTWDIWIKNIWQTTKLTTENDQIYAQRVWDPILGDRENNEAKIVFSDGLLSLSEDYEFVIIGTPVYDTSKTFVGKDGTFKSHWRITLAKSDADLEALNVMLPSTTRFAVAGNHFLFTGIDMPHFYVVKAEERLDDFKKDELLKVKDIVPTYVVGLDKVRIHNYGEANALVDQLEVGSMIRLYDPRFIPGSHELSLYIQSLTFTYSEPTDKEANLLPEVEVVLSNDFTSSAKTVSQLSGEVSAIQKQLGSISNVAEIVRKVGDSVYLRKDTYDRAAAQIDFMQGLATYGDAKLREGATFGSSFAEGITGFGGKIDKYGDAWLGGLSLRSFLEVPELRYNRTEISIGNDWNAPGGGIISSVTPDYNSNGTIADTGTITLHLEDGEIGAVAVDDICMGIFHSHDINNNSVVDFDNGSGNFRFAGFGTVYFRITKIIDSGRNSVLRYSLRPATTSWAAKIHPSSQMSFVAYGNFADVKRRTSRYSTRTYERYLVNVDDWEFKSANIAAQFGDLSNLSLFGIDMKGYSAYLNNIYMSGHIEQLDLSPRLEIDFGNDTYIATGETKTITTRVLRGWEQQNVTQWRVARSSGDSSSDATWNNQHSGSFDGTLSLSQSDLGSGESATFTITATIGTTLLQDQLILRRTPSNGIDGQPGKDGYSFTNNMLKGTKDWSSFVKQDGWTIEKTPRENDGLYIATGQLPSGKNNIDLYQNGVVEFEPDTVYTLSVDLKGSGLALTFVYPNVNAEIIATHHCNISRPTENDTQIQHTLTENWERHYVVFRTQSDISGGKNVLLRVQNAGSIVYACGVKLEKGDNRDPQWTLHPDEYKGDKGDKGEKGEEGQPGKQGNQGIQGCIYRATEWLANTEYRNDTDIKTDSLRYIDITLVPNITLATKAKAYRCKLTHISSGSNAPGTTGGSAYWEELNSMAPIFTPLLLADNAVITLLQSNQVVVMKSDGSTVNVALGGGDYPLWIGDEEPLNANFSVNDKGKAKLNEADINGKLTAGVKDGQRVEIQPDSMAMKIYDSTGVEVSSYEGNTYADKSKLFSSASGNVTMLKRSAAGYGASAGIAYSQGYVYKGGSNIDNFYDDSIIISSAVNTDAPVEFSINGTLYVEYKKSYYQNSYDFTVDSGTSGDSGSSTDPSLIGGSKHVLVLGSLAAISLTLETYSNAALSDLVSSQVVAKATETGATVSFNQKKIKTTTGGYHILRLSFSITVNSNAPATVRWGSNVSNGYEIAASYLSDFYVSRYFANGLCLGVSENNYLWAYNDGSDGMRYVFENNGYGLELSNKGFRRRHHLGDWVSEPLFLFRGYCSINSSRTAYSLSDTISFDGSIPSASHVAEGKARLTFPSAWTSKLSLSRRNLIVHLSGYGTVSGASSPCKANVGAITSNYIEIYLSDNETLNDGAFLISLYYQEI